LLGLLLLAAPAAAGEAPVDSTDAALAAAQAALAAGRAGEAERLYREVIAREPGLADAYQGLAGALAAEGRKEEAVAALLAVGEGLVAAGLYEPAAESLRRAAGLAPPAGPVQARVQAQLGRALVLGRKPLAAVEALARAVELGRDDPLTRQYQGAALWEAGRLDEAEAVYRRLVVEDRGGFQPLEELGRLLLWRGRAPEAVDLLARAVAAEPGAADARIELARALAAAGKTAEAETAYRHAIELAPRRADARYGLALLLARAAAPAAKAEAARELEVYRKLTAEERERTRREGLERAQLDGAWFLLRQGQTAEAAARFAALPESGDSLAGLAAAHAAAGDHQKAIEALERALALAPDRQDFRWKLAEERLLARPR